ncbi:ABC transporter ATP-binding protein [uncultured Desulfobacter sp.]|uniref:ABC transporter ATP-binding protein n=1 Tax=uncultured Desulfobacter sp. TaxID=240139 RepID=UPI002AABAE06|nr:ABC transporter ATP-binding protein [uncultured Desulfobacter sp.]
MMLKLADIKKSYRLGPVDVDVLKGVNLTVEPGDMLSVVGTSGCGKSTLMNIMGFLDSPSAGYVYFEDKDVSHLTDSQLSIIRNQKIGFVFQQFHLLWRLTALENVCLPLLYRGVDTRQRIRVARDMLAMVDMSDLGDRKPAELSSGQQQRVAIARALSGTPSLILADEPTGALDANVGQDIMNLFLDLNRNHGNTIVIVTHNPNIAKQCRRAVRMRDGMLYEDWI